MKKATPRAPTEASSSGTSVAWCSRPTIEAADGQDGQHTHVEADGATEGTADAAAEVVEVEADTEGGGGPAPERAELPLHQAQGQQQRPHGDGQGTGAPVHPAGEADERRQQESAAHAVGEELGRPGPSRPGTRSGRRQRSVTT